MPTNRIPSNRPLLQRRKSLKTTFQSMLDGIIVVFTVYLTFVNIQGFLSILDVIFLVSLLAIMGLSYDRMAIYRQYDGIFNSAKKLLFSWSVSYAIVIFIFIMSGFYEEISQPALSAIYLIAFTGQLLNRFLFYTINKKTALANEDRHHVLLVGDTALVKELFDRINRNPWLQEKAIGRIQVTKQSEACPVPILGPLDKIEEIVENNNIKTVYIAVALTNSKIVEEIYHKLVDKNVDIHWAPNIFSMDLVNPSVKEIAGIPLLTLSESPLIGNYRLLKEIEDRSLALILIILLSPLMLVTAILIKLESRGPVIFKQNRTGWDGKVFHIWKFRSMKPHKEKEGQIKQATADDDRFTRVGKFIRKTSIDELPQLFNVLSGRMSLVGPRPHAVEHNLKYSKEISAYLARHRIKPGITGLAQVSGYRGETETLDKMQKRVDYDMEYINTWSFWLDLEILFKTLPSMLRDKAY